MDKESMRRSIEIHNKKSLRLDNVLIKDYLCLSTLCMESEEAETNQSLDFEVEKMINEIKARGAAQVGPLIQYSDTYHNQEDLDIKVTLMIQADRYIKNLQPPYQMESVIQAKNCMYTRFSGLEEDIHFAYQKIGVTAYEEGIKLKGNSYTIFLDSSNDGTITADIFMEKEDA